MFIILQYKIKSFKLMYIKQLNVFADKSQSLKDFKDPSSSLPLSSFSFGDMPKIKQHKWIQQAVQ